MSIPNHSATFLQEAEELLQQVEAVVLDLEASPGDMELVNRLFRAFHTIKGSGSMFGFDAVACFTHHVESTLDKVREGRLSITPPLVTLILESKDHIHTLLESDPAGSPALSVLGDRIAAELGRIAGGSASTIAAAPVAAATLESPRSRAIYTVFFRPDPTIFLSGLDPVCLLNELRALGDCTIETHLDAVPPLEELEADRCFLAWTVTLTTSQPESSIRDVFIFAEDGAELRIERTGAAAEPVESKASEPTATAKAPAAEAVRPPPPPLPQTKPPSHNLPSASLPSGSTALSISSANSSSINPA